MRWHILRNTEKVTDWKETMENLMKDLYSYRDRFFETHTIEKASEKRELVEKKMKEVLDEFDNLTRK